VIKKKGYTVAGGVMEYGVGGIAEALIYFTVGL